MVVNKYCTVHLIDLVRGGGGGGAFYGTSTQEPDLTSPTYGDSLDALLDEPLEVVGVVTSVLLASVIVAGKYNVLNIRIEMIE